MESLPKDEILEYNNDTLEDVRKCFNLHKPGEMKDAVDILEEWIQRQNHFTRKEFERRYLEMTIIMCKGSIERAKTRLDRACTVRTLIPHLFDTCDLRSLYNKDLKDVKQAVLPKMTTSHDRVYIARNSTQKMEPTIMRSYNLSVVNMAEYIRRKDYAASYYAVIDYSDVNMTELLSTHSFDTLQELAALLLECCGFRVKGICFITSSKLIEVFVDLVKKILKTKLGERIHVLKNRDELQNMIERRILPVEYGGDEKSLDELHEQWLDVLTSEDHLRYMRDMAAARTDETRRQKDSFNEHYMGMPGTFRTIILD